jgi:hypothetical protein
MVEASPSKPDGASPARRKTAPKPSVKVAPKLTAKPSGVARPKTFRRKCPLPSIKNIAWEYHRAGGWECWYCPARTKDRAEKVYLGYVGKRLLKSWEGLMGEERRVVVKQWVDQRRQEKGID